MGIFKLKHFTERSTDEWLLSASTYITHMLTHAHELNILTASEANIRR